LTGEEGKEKTKVFFWFFVLICFEIIRTDTTHQTTEKNISPIKKQAAARTLSAAFFFPQMTEVKRSGV